MGLGLGAAISGIGSLFGAGITGSASKKAAEIQAQAALQAAGIQQQDVGAGLAQQSGFFDIASKTLSPFINAGQGLYGNLASMIPGLVQSFNPTMDQLEKTPGYQFTLGQTEKTGANLYAGRGLASSAAPGAYSGPEMKGAMDYAAGLASNTYQQQFQNYWSNIQNTIASYLSPASVGAGAGAALASTAGGAGSSALGAFGQLGAGQAGLVAGAGQAGAAGTLGSASAAAGGIAGAGNAFNQYATLNALLSSGALGGGAAGGGIYNGLGNNSILASLGGLGSGIGSLFGQPQITNEQFNNAGGAGPNPYIV